MREIDLNTWARREHYAVFSQLDHPHFSLCATVEITNLLALVRARRWSLFRTFLYIAAQTANAIPEFRYRIRGDKVVEHETVHPSFTVMGKNDLFGFCTMDYNPDFAAFCREAEEAGAAAAANPSVHDEPGRDDLLFITCIPWVSFTSFVLPVGSKPPDSVPRLAWGKFTETAGRVTMPVAVQVHHALVDGLHVGNFFSRCQGLCHAPELLGQ